MSSVFILGRQPAIGRAELESLYGSDHLTPISSEAISCDLPPSEITFSRLGSTVKMGVYLGTIKGASPSVLQKELPAFVARCAAAIPEGKIQLGVSAYGGTLHAKQLLAIGLTLKKDLRNQNRSVRLIPNQEAALSSAQVLHNHLTGEQGIELLLIRYKDSTVVAKSVAVQDITAYAKRDQARPKRDAFVGMLPPKLAQTIVNLATSSADPQLGGVVLDPFCGTGVVLQEATLMGFNVYGTDLNPRMVDYSDQNLMWLLDQPGIPVTRPPEAADDQSWRYFKLEVGDATNHTWQPAPQFVACEGYLGHPLTSWPRPEKLQTIISTCNLIFEKFLTNIAAQIKPQTRLCIAAPAWISPEGKVFHLPALDHLEKMGYNRVSFKYSREAEMLYHRSDQLVARELLVITRK